MGLAMPKQYCQAVTKAAFLGDIDGQESPNHYDS